MTILDLLEEAARQDPDAPALLAPSRVALSYEELRHQTVDTIAALGSVGIGAGDKVAVVLPNGPEMASAVVAVASAAICAPLNPAYGTEEFRFYLNDLQPSALLLPAGQEGPARRVARELGIRCLDVRWDDEERAGRFALADCEQLTPVFVAPRDATEARVAGIFAEVLGSGELGAFCNFFSSGGDSLRGFQALARVRDQFQVDLSIIDLFKAPTPALLAAQIGSSPRGSTSAALERMLAEIEGLSDEEAEAQLRQLQDGANDMRS